ncbi:MAG: hypothetical protein IPJ69_11675 [Deltaproteobacteria bacterium]|nr:MAG: hypothetical protein IPJ69_11675 [Deltaproteobacteria bacterium]
MGTEDSSRIGQRPLVSQPSHEVHDHQEVETHDFSQPVQQTIEQNHDRYGSQLVNRVMRGLSALMLHRGGRAADVASRSSPSSHADSLDSMILKDGKLVSTKGSKSDSPTIRHSKDISKQELSAFEKVFLAHFESGAAIGEKLPPGIQKFLKKGTQEWVGFFNHLAPFAMKKSVKAGDIQSVIFRGVLEEVVDGKKQIFLISDVTLPAQPGRLQKTVEKFVRIALPEQQDILLQLLNELSQKNSGDALPTEFTNLLAKLGSEGLFSYEALSHRIMDASAVTNENKFLAETYQSPDQVRLSSMREGTRQSTQGIALDARTEALMVSQHLPGSLSMSPKTLGPMKKKNGGDEERFLENPLIQIPPYLLNLPKSRLPSFKGKPKWYIAFIYSIVSTLVLIGVSYILRHLL